MPDAALAALALPGLWWLAATLVVAGIVRGFSGFGSALVFVPVAGIFLPPVHVIAIIALVEIGNFAALVPRAWGQADRRQVGLLAVSALPAVPLGLWGAEAFDITAVRWVVTALAGGTLLALVSGWKYTGRVRLPLLVGVGVAAGFFGGMTGMTGPFVVLFYLAGRGAVQSVRANTILFLAALDLAIVINLLLRGFADPPILWLAALLAVPYLLAMIAGQALFHPAHERLYRRAALAIIALSVAAGLPIWT